MVITGVIRKEKGGWYAGCDAIGVFTQGTSRKHATDRLVEAIEMKAGRKGWHASIAELDGDAVLIDSDRPEVLAAEVLKHQRFMSGLSLADVQKRMGVKSRNEFAAYEKGERDPSIAKFRALLAAVAPDMALAVVPRRSK